MFKLNISESKANILERTERTYVKGLQELVDIYVKPSSAPVNLISGVGSGKETIIPASERKIVFNGIEALFSFHKESFLPALEDAATPLMTRPPAGEELDADGQLSIEVTKRVAGIFLKHAAFMKMYSSYIKYVTICHCEISLLIRLLKQF